MLDVDICGPSIPKVMGLEGEQVSIPANGIFFYQNGSKVNAKQANSKDLQVSYELQCLENERLQPLHYCFDGKWEAALSV